MPNEDNSVKSTKILLAGLLAALVFVIGHVSAAVIYTKENRFPRAINAAVNQIKNDSDKSLEPEDMGLFWEVYDQLNANYIGKDLPEDKDLVESATKGLIAGLDDRYTNYYTPDEWRELQSSNSGQFQGVGIKLLGGEVYALVETPIVGSPAQKAGIMAQDTILEVNGEKMENVSVSKVAEKIRGPKGTKVKIKVYRPSSGQTLDFEITRADIDVDSIEAKKLTDGGYQIIVSKFTESSYTEFQTQWLATVDAVYKENPKYIVLDLRNNTGGWVDAAKFILGEFMTKNSLILIEENREGEQEKFYTDREGKFTKTPLVVLVNSGSASATEIVAGALQDSGRAKLVGESTLGKGVEQRVITTSDGGSLHVVFKKWLTPKGRNLSSDNALKPDKEVKLSTKDVQAGKDPQLDAARNVVK